MAALTPSLPFPSPPPAMPVPFLLSYPLYISLPLFLCVYFRFSYNTLAPLLPSSLFSTPSRVWSLSNERKRLQNESARARFLLTSSLTHLCILESLSPLQSTIRWPKRKRKREQKDTTTSRYLAWGIRKISLLWGQGGVKSSLLVSLVHPVAWPKRVHLETLSIKMFKRTFILGIVSFLDSLFGFSFIYLL